jgi:DNA repair photolyase
MLGMVDRPDSQPDDFTYSDALPVGHQRGRGAQLNPGNRFESTRLHVLGEHLDLLHAQQIESDDEEGKKVVTHVYHDRTQTLINHVESPDVGMTWTLNAYRGCEHGCIYCYARPFHEHLGFSSGLDFETRIMAKFDAPRLLKQELNKRSWKGEPIHMSGVTDCYQPLEKKLRLTRQCLEIMTECRQPVTIITKNHLVTRDIDLYSELARYNAACVGVSVTSLDSSVAAKLEPRASSPQRRLEAIRKLSEAGVPVFVMVAPIVPGLTDQEVPAILKAVSEAGAVWSGYTIMRLPYQVKALFLDWVRREYPQKAQRMESQLRSMRNGRHNESEFGSRMRGEGLMAQQICSVFKVFSSRYGLDKPWPHLSSEHFRRPGELSQGVLF